MWSLIYLVTTVNTVSTYPPLSVWCRAKVLFYLRTGLDNATSFEHDNFPRRDTTQS